MFTEISLPAAILIGAGILATAILLAGWIIARGNAQRTAVGQPMPFFPMLPPLPPLPPEAMPVEPSGIAVDTDTKLEIGTRVLTEWNGLWFRAEIIGLESGGRLKIHYLGWDASWDEEVSRGRLQVDLSGSLGD